MLTLNQIQTKVQFIAKHFGDLPASAIEGPIDEIYVLFDAEDKPIEIVFCDKAKLDEVRRSPKTSHLRLV